MHVIVRQTAGYRESFCSTVEPPVNLRPPLMSGLGGPFMGGGRILVRWSFKTGGHSGNSTVRKKVLKSKGYSLEQELSESFHRDQYVI